MRYAAWCACVCVRVYVCVCVASICGGRGGALATNAPIDIDYCSDSFGNCNRPLDRVLGAHGDGAGGL